MQVIIAFLLGVVLSNLVRSVAGQIRGHAAGAIGG